jgi:N-ethylmaleimide reductase
MSLLFTPLDCSGFIPLRNRIVMSAMSRSFAPGTLATDAMRDYYAKRAKAGLILTEGTIIHSSGDGWKDAPHIETQRQADSWKGTIEAVHAHGGKIACQLWHMGRISHADFTGGAPVSSTNVPAAGVNRQNNKPYGEPRALEPKEMPQVIRYFVDAAKRAMDVGFDAVELHAGHGYLIDQFLDGHVNDRSDKYGGSVENRCRFPLEVVEAVLAAVPTDRVIARISPSRMMGGVYEWPDLQEMLEYFIPALQQLGLRALDVSCANSDYTATAGHMVRKIRPLWNGAIIGGASLTTEQAEAELEERCLDAVTWGRAFIANPDLVDRIKSGTKWTVFEDSMRGSLADPVAAG